MSAYNNHCYSCLQQRYSELVAQKSNRFKYRGMAALWHEPLEVLLKTLYHQTATQERANDNEEGTVLWPSSWHGRPHFWVKTASPNELDEQRQQHCLIPGRKGLPQVLSSLDHSNLNWFEYTSLKKNQLILGSTATGSIDKDMKPLTQSACDHYRARQEGKCMILRWGCRGNTEGHFSMKVTRVEEKLGENEDLEGIKRGRHLGLNEACQLT